MPTAVPRARAATMALVLTGSFVAGPVLSSLSAASAAPSARVVTGTNGPDTIDQSAGPHGVTIRGLGGKDLLIGSRFADRIDGGPGADRITGGPGADRLTGGRGNDLFVFRPGDLKKKVKHKGGGVDRITDFAGAGTRKGQQDRIGLQGFPARTRLVFQRRVDRRTQIYQVRTGKKLDGRVTVVLKKRPWRHLNAADVVVLAAPKPPPTSPPGAPRALPDDIAFDLGAHPDQVTADVLDNDVDPTGGTLAAKPASGTWTINGDDVPAGRYTIAADGTLTLDSGTDPLGPLQELRSGEPATATLAYTVTNGKGAATGTIHVAITGGSDAIVRFAQYAGPNGVQLNYNDQTPTVFDARGCYADPQGEPLTYRWTAASTKTVPVNPVFYAGESADHVSITPVAWGVPSTGTLHLDVSAPGDATISDQSTFYVPYPAAGADPSSYLQPCGTITHRPQLRDHTLDAARSIPGNTLTLGNVLDGAVDPDGETVTASGRGVVGGYGDQGPEVGSYKVNPNGSVTISFTQAGRQNVLDGTVSSFSFPVRGIDPEGHVGVASMRVDFTGAPATAPVATTDDVTWALPDRYATGSDQFTTNVLANDTDPAGNALTASGGGTWYLDGDPTPAGTFTVAADGTLTMNDGSDPLGPVQELRQGERWSATLQYQVSDGSASSPGTVDVEVVGGSDPIFETVPDADIGPLIGPDGQELWFNDPNPMLFDGRGCWMDPDGEFMQYSWDASSSVVGVPPEPPFVAKTNVSTVSVLNQDWGLGSSDSVTLTMYPAIKAPASHTIHFLVGDDVGGPYGSATIPAVSACTSTSGRPYTPDVTLPTLDMGTVSGNTATFNGNVLTTAVEPNGQPMTAGGYGYVGDYANPYGTYRINADGTVTVTMDPAHPLPSGQSLTFDAPYRAIGPAGIGVGHLVMTVIGAG